MIVQENVCHGRLKDIYHEARIQCVISHYANVLGEVIKKDRVRQEIILQRETDLTEEEYLRWMPAWCDKDLACWEAIVRYWRSDACYQEKNERRGRRLNNAGVAHHQGNRSLPQFMDAWSGAHGGEEINEVVGYALSHKGKATDPDNRYDPEDGPDAYTNVNVQPNLAEYIAAFRRRHGEDKDPTQEPLDTELMMRLGGGKQHGSYWMANSAIDPTTTPTLREIRRVGSSSSSDIPIAPRRPSTAQMLTQMEARFQ